MAKLQELSLLDIIGERKNRYEFSFTTTFNAYLPFYEQIALRRLTIAGCRVNTVLIDAGQFAVSVKDAAGRPLLAGRNYTIIPVDAGRGVFHPKILLFLGREHATVCVGSHNLTLSGFGKNRELTTVFETNPNGDASELRIFRDVWRALRSWTANQPEELLDAFLFVEKEVPWLTAADDDPIAENSNNLFFSAGESGLSLWEQIKPNLPNSVSRVTLISPFFDEDLKFLREIKNRLNPKEFIVGVETKSVQLAPQAQILFPDIRFVEADVLRDGRGYLHAKAVYLETEAGEDILIAGSANASGAAWLGNGGGRRNYESVVVLRSKDAASAVKVVGLKELAKRPAIKPQDWQLIERNKLKRMDLFSAEKEKLSLLTAVETENGFRIASKKLQAELGSIAELVNADGETIFMVQIAHAANETLFIEVEDAQIRFSTNTIKINSAASGESFTAFVHHTPAIVTKFYKSQHREFFAALESFDMPVDDKFWRLFEKIVFVEGDELPDYMEAQISHRAAAQNLIVRNDDGETLQETFSIKTADIGFKQRLNQNSLDTVSELLSFLNRRLYAPSEFAQNLVPAAEQIEDDDFETEEYETEEIVDPKFEVEKIASVYSYRTRTMMRRMTKKLAALDRAENRVCFAAVRQLAVVLGVLHWMRQLETSERFSLCETGLVSIEDEWKLFVAATAFIGSMNDEISKKPFSEEISMVAGYLVWLGFDCGFDVIKLDELRRQSYGEERADGWTNEEILEGIACFLKLAVVFGEDERARKIFEKAIENENPADWIERNVAWLERVNQASKDILSLPLAERKARVGDLVYLTKMKEKEILAVSGDAGSIEVIVLNAENRRKKYSAETVAAINF